MPPTKTGFVVMPFSPTKSETDWTEIYTEVFQPALQECGYRCTRAEVSTGNLITSIVEQLIEADIVIVDVTDRNANVFYELGVRHSLRRGTIIVSQSAEHVPSDLKGYWFLIYGLRPALVKAFKADIRRVIELFEKDPLKSDNPVSDFLDKAHRSSFRETNRENLKKIGAFITEITGNRVAIQQHLSTGKAQLLSVGCIQLLLHTRYLDVGTDLLKSCYELEYHLEVIRRDSNVSKVVLASTLKELDSIFMSVSRIRDDVSAGEFTEPTTISMMKWSPMRSSYVVLQTCDSALTETFDEPDSERSRLDDVGEINFSVPQADFGACENCGSRIIDGANCRMCGAAFLNPIV